MTNLQRSSLHSKNVLTFLQLFLMPNLIMYLTQTVLERPNAHYVHAVSTAIIIIISGKILKLKKWVIIKIDGVNLGGKGEMKFADKAEKQGQTDLS